MSKPIFFRFFALEANRLFFCLTKPNNRNIIIIERERERDRERKRQRDRERQRETEKGEKERRKEGKKRKGAILVKCPLNAVHHCIVDARAIRRLEPWCFETV